MQYLLSFCGRWRRISVEVDAPSLSIRWNISFDIRGLFGFFVVFLNQTTSSDLPCNISGWVIERFLGRNGLLPRHSFRRLLRLVIVDMFMFYCVHCGRMKGAMFVYGVAFEVCVNQFPAGIEFECSAAESRTSTILFRLDIGVFKYYVRRMFTAQMMSWKRMICDHSNAIQVACSKPLVSFLWFSTCQPRFSGLSFKPVSHFLSSFRCGRMLRVLYIYSAGNGVKLCSRCANHSNRAEQVNVALMWWVFLWFTICEPPFSVLISWQQAHTFSFHCLNQSPT